RGHRGRISCSSSSCDSLTLARHGDTGGSGGRSVVAFSRPFAILRCIRERLPDRPPERGGQPTVLGPAEYRKVVSNARGWPLEYINVEATAGRGFTFEAGRWGTAPVYFTHDGATV